MLSKQAQDMTVAEDARICKPKLSDRTWPDKTLKDHGEKRGSCHKRAEWNLQQQLAEIQHSRLRQT